MPMGGMGFTVSQCFTIESFDSLTEPLGWKPFCSVFFPGNRPWMISGHNVRISRNLNVYDGPYGPINSALAKSSGFKRGRTFRCELLAFAPSSVNSQVGEPNLLNQLMVVFGMRLIRRPWKGCQFWDVPFTIPWKGGKFQKWGLRKWGYRIWFFWVFNMVHMLSYDHQGGGVGGGVGVY